MTEDQPKQTYYQRNKDHVRAKAKEYYQRVTEGHVGRRNEKRPPQTGPKKPRGRPRKTAPETNFADANGAFVSPEDNRDVIFETLTMPDETVV